MRILFFFLTFLSFSYQASYADGFLDVVEGNFEERNYVYMGNAVGTFKEIGLREDLKDDTYNVTVGDLNKDGLLDIVESNSGSWNLYYRTVKE